MSQLFEIIDSAIQSKATDIHITEQCFVRLRIDGLLIETTIKAVDVAGMIDSIFTSLPETESKRFREKFILGDDVDCAFSSKGKTRIRANIYRKESGLSVALRIIPIEPLSAKDIGIPAAAIEFCNARSGIFIVTGASGCGKSTTLASMLNLINERRKVHILTIEDPIEYLIPSKTALISQREVGVHTTNFYSALRSAMRENPDIVMLGEMRDLETTRAVLEMAETGHLILATLHTRTSISAIDRIIGQFPDKEQSQIRMMLSESLLGVLAQNLVAKRSGGLTAAFELLIANAAIRNCIREQKTSQMMSVMQTSANIGMTIMEDNLEKLVLADIITPEEALYKAPSRALLLERFRNNPLINGSTNTHKR